ncbi:flagellin, partial [Colwellia sp. 4_MG-2023]|uniref:flagellin n=1 Tax=unclassified Colwellia TaxID=196834 RepID=UPI0026E3D7E0
NGSNGADDRAALQKEVGALQQELTRISETTKFGATALLDGTFGTKQFQVGSNANETINVSLGNMAADSIGAYGVAGSGTVLGVAAEATILDTQLGDVTNDTISMNGTEVTVAADIGAADIADAINAKATGVTATAKLDVTISALSSGDDGTINMMKGGNAVDDYDLADYGGDIERLAEDLQADGYDAIVDGTTLTLKAEDVDGIEVAGSTTTTSTLSLNNNLNTGALLASANANMSVSSSISLSSPDKIGISGTTVNEILGKGAGGVALAATGGTGALTSVEDIDISGTTSVGAQSAIQTIDAALAQIDSQRADLGAVQNRFSHTISNLSNVAENVSASRSRIEDTDFASETATMTKNQILQQAGTTILAQSNQLPQAALSLLG